MLMSEFGNPNGGSYDDHAYRPTARGHSGRACHRASCWMECCVSNGDIAPSDLLNERINIRGEIEGIKAILTEREKAVQAALATAKEALAKAETATEKRLDLLNEFRAQAKDEQSRFVLKEGHEKDVESLARDVKRIEGFVNRVLGVALISPFVLGLIVLVVNITSKG